MRRFPTAGGYLSFGVRQVVPTTGHSDRHRRRYRLADSRPRRVRHHTSSVVRAEQTSEGKESERGRLSIAEQEGGPEEREEIADCGLMMLCYETHAGKDTVHQITVGQCNIYMIATRLKAGVKL